MVGWPSAYTDHSVKNSKWRNGKADIIKDLAESCKKYNLKFGVYLSPWDRNHMDYGTTKYINYFRNQLKELLTNYGDIFEVWFDGANGGDGYYGGANEVRKVDKKNYYDWENTVKIVRELQPDAVVFSDAGPDIRWVGNEKGYANQTTWSPILKDSLYPGMLNFNKFSAGQENGTHWIPTETDVSIRPGWYYHPEQDNQVKTVEKLIDIYFNSVGLNSALLLNIPVDTRGLIHENDEASLRGLNNYIQTTFDKNLAKNRGGLGVKTMNLNEGDAISRVHQIPNLDDQLFLLSQKGTVIRISASQTKETAGRSSKGTRVMELRNKEKNGFIDELIYSARMPAELAEQIISEQENIESKEEE